MRNSLNSMKDSQALDYATMVLPSKIVFLFIVTDYLIWKFYFPKIYNDKSGSWLSIYECFLVSIQHRNLAFEEFCAADIRVH